MKGIHKVVVGTKYLKYEFELRRNLTIIRGNSATGKTTLVDMIRTHMNDGESGPVTLNCDKSCYVVEGNLWKGQLDNIQDSIVFIDEGNEFVRTKDFARAIQQTDNYYVIVTREGLPALPYSVEEVYGIRTSGKYGTLKQSYHSFYRIYPDSTTENIKPEKILTEDSNSGYQFFDAVCKEQQIQCDTANGKSNVFSYLKAHRNEKIMVIADGAAFGPEMDRVLQLVHTRENLVLYLPESFEWLILKSGILKNNQIDQILDEPAEYIESRDYFSWERFFTSVLIENTRDTYLAYAKKKLNAAYLGGTVEEAILRQMEKIELGWKKELTDILHGEDCEINHFHI